MYLLYLPHIILNTLTFYILLKARLQHVLLSSKFSWKCLFKGRVIHTLAGIIHWKLCSIEHGFIRHAREAKERSIVIAKHGQEDDILMNTHFIIQITESVYSWSLFPASEIAQWIHVRFHFSLFAVFIFILTLPSGHVNKSCLQPWQSFGKLPELVVQGACYTTTSFLQ
jgi:hypothetical protein